MRIDADEGFDRAPEELERIDRDGWWFVAFANPDPTTADRVKWIVHGMTDRDSAELLAEAMAEKYRDRPTWAVGLDRDYTNPAPRLILYVAAELSGKLPGVDASIDIVAACRDRLRYLIARDERARAKFTAAESAKVPPVPEAGPDLDDHLYAGKVIPIPGTPAAARAAARDAGDGIDGDEDEEKTYGSKPPAAAGGEGGGG